MSGELSREAKRIFDNVLVVLQDAEEIHGPEGDNYVALMEAIAAEAKQRIANYQEWQPVHFDVDDSTHGFKWRLRCGDTTTEWALYSQPCYLHGVVGASPYYAGGQEIKLMTPDAFARLMAVRAARAG